MTLIIPKKRMTIRKPSAFFFAVELILLLTVFANTVLTADETTSKQTQTTIEQKADWGMKASTAVVNPVVRSPFSKFISLSGEWDFKTIDVWRYRLGVGEPGWGNRIFDWSGTRKIIVPGNWESQGVGEPGPNVTWDCDWDCARWDLRHVYMGRAIYRKSAPIPSDWKNSQIWLKIGGVRSEAWIWVNGNRACYVNNYCGTEKFNITPFVKPGENAEIIAMVRNDVPSRKGLLSVTHRFGGFYRDIELEATPEIFIDDVWIRGQVDEKSAQVNVFIGKSDLKNTPDSIRQTVEPKNDSPTIKGSIDLVIKTKEGEQVGKGSASFDRTGKIVMNCPIKNCRFWTPEDPYLYYVDLVLKDGTGSVKHGWSDRFGVRKLEVRGDRFYLNGKPYYFRGGGDHNYDSLTITEYPNRSRFIEHQKIYKAAGFNYMRHHTHAPLPEYFEAADETGILLQPELPYYHDVPTEGFSFDPMRDMTELFRNYRRYTSFATYCYGNEGYLGHPIDVQLYQWVKKNDPDRLVLHEDGGRTLPENSDYLTGVPGNFCSSLIKPWKPGICDDLKMPVVTHEYLNLAIKMDPHLEPKFTGVRVSPISMQKYRDLLKETGLTEYWGNACLRAAEGLQAIYQKEGIEFARSEAVCDGHVFWSLVDASIPQGNTVAAQGYLDTFWQIRKNGNKPETFYRFNGPTALLLKTNPDVPIAVAGDQVSAEFRISHYSPEDIPAGVCDWKISGSNGDLVSGSVSFDTIKNGFAGLVKTFKVSIPNVSKPIRAKFQLAIRGTKYFNNWNYWIFPKRQKPDLTGCVVSADLFDFFSKHYRGAVKYGDPKMKASDLLITRRDTDELFQAVKEGRNILILSAASPRQNVRLGWWGIATQVGTAFRDHPAYGDFPKTDWMDQLWFRLIREGAPDLRTETPLGRMEPLAVGEGRESYYLYLGEGKSDQSKILASFAIDLTQNLPEALALLDNLIRYAKSDSFRPVKMLNIGLLKEAVPKGTVLGYRKILFSTEPASVWKTYKEEDGTQHTCRQLSKKNRIDWSTVPVRSDLDKQEGASDEKNAKNSTTFIFAGGLGYYEMPVTDGFVFSINDKELIRFDLPDKNAQANQKIVWKSKDGRACLTFEILRKTMPGPDWFGKFYLTVPNEIIKKGDKQKLSVRSLGEGSHRWFAVFPFRDLK